MGNINPRGKISPEDYLYLYWFHKLNDNFEGEYADFQPTESMINSYNRYVEQWKKKFLDDRVHYEKSIDWDVSRQKTPYFKEKLQAGREFEIWVEEKFLEQGVDLKGFLDESGQYSGENEFGLEIKHDMKLAETGNIYIEYQERLKNTAGWVNSGILKKDNSKFWMIGSSAEYYIFRKADLLALYHKLCTGSYIKGCQFVKEKLNGTSKGFIINRARARELACAVDIKEFIGLLQRKYYAHGCYYHGNRQCKYIMFKKDSDLRVFSTVEDAEASNYKRCTNLKCFE